MHRANEVRPIFKRLGQLTEQTGCAIVLVGHITKCRAGRALEGTDNAVSMRDATAIHGHADRKTLRREREKKIALGHKADDHEDEQTQQQTM